METKQICHCKQSECLAKKNQPNEIWMNIVRTTKEKETLAECWWDDSSNAYEFELYTMERSTCVDKPIGRHNVISSWSN